MQNLWETSLTYKQYELAYQVLRKNEMQQQN
jgi:hypothetical protein